MQKTTYSLCTYVMYVTVTVTAIVTLQANRTTVIAITETPANCNP